MGGRAESKEGGQTPAWGLKRRMVEGEREREREKPERNSAGEEQRADQQNHGEEPPFVFPWLQGGRRGGSAVNIVPKGRSRAPISRQ